MERSHTVEVCQHEMNFEKWDWDDFGVAMRNICVGIANDVFNGIVEEIAQEESFSIGADLSLQCFLLQGDNGAAITIEEPLKDVLAEFIQIQGSVDEVARIREMLSELVAECDRVIAAGPEKYEPMILVGAPEPPPPPVWVKRQGRKFVDGAWHEMEYEVNARV